MVVTGKDGSEVVYDTSPCPAPGQPNVTVTVTDTDADTDADVTDIRRLINVGINEQPTKKFRKFHSSKKYFSFSVRILEHRIFRSHDNDSNNSDDDNNNSDDDDDDLALGKMYLSLIAQVLEKIRPQNLIS